MSFRTRVRGGWSWAVVAMHRLGVVALALFAIAALPSCTGEIHGPSESPAFSQGAGGTAAGSAVCGSFATSCNGACVFLSTDPSNCGACGVQCPAGATCNDGACPGASCTGASCATSCPAGESSCNGACTDTSTDAAHCGSCTTACTGGQVCDSGSCQAASSGCSNGLTVCGTSCVDLTSSDANCGACGVACQGGQLCTAGSCACPSGQTSCGAACVDTATDSANCGSCGKACTGGTVCTAGTCGCATGSAVCNGACTDITTDPKNCGACNQTCGSGQTCSAGNCEAPSGADGCGTTALDISISQIAVYQSVKIPLETNGQAVDPTARNADLTQGREALFRVYVHPESGWAPRQLSARVNITNGTTQDQFFAKATPSTDSTDADTTSTFQIDVPAAKIQDATQYSVELAECATGTGTAASPRFPATGQTALSARQTGPLKIVIVPVQTNGHTPDTSDGVLALYRAMMMAMYPITDISITAGTGISTDYPIDWSGMLDQIRAQRESDQPASDVYYFGFVTPTDTLQQYCQVSCTAGIGFVADENDASSRAAVGLAFDDETSVETMAHEVGHNHGRNHSPCAPGGQISGVDPNYPYPNAEIGVWGYDIRGATFHDPIKSTDIMGYCNDKWISDYTYEGLLNRVAYVNGAPEVVENAALVASYRVLIVDAHGPRWGIPFSRPGMPYGTAEQADVLDANGAVMTTTTVYRTEIADGAGSSLLVPEPKAGWSSVRVRGATPLSFAAPQRHLTH